MPKGIPGEATLARRVLASNKELQVVLQRFAQDGARKPEALGAAAAVAIAAAFTLGQTSTVERMQDRIAGVVRSVAFEVGQAGNA